MIGELKQIWILNLKFVMIVSLPLEYKSFLWFLCWHIHRVLNHPKQTKNEEEMKLELERGLKLFLQKNWSKQSLIFFLQFVHPITQKSLNLIKE